MIWGIGRKVSRDEVAAERRVEAAAQTTAEAFERGERRRIEREIADGNWRFHQGDDPFALPDDAPAFEIKDMDNGKVYRIWADGRTEGFEHLNSRMVMNRIPYLVHRARQLGR